MGKSISSEDKQKYYKKLNIDLRREKNLYWEYLETERKINIEYAELIKKQEKEIEELKLANEKLQSILELSDKEVKELVSAAIKTNALAHLIKTISNRP